MFERIVLSGKTELFLLNVQVARLNINVWCQTISKAFSMSNVSIGCYFVEVIIFCCDMLAGLIEVSLSVLLRNRIVLVRFVCVFIVRF